MDDNELVCGESYEHDLNVWQDDKNGFYAVCRKCDAEIIDDNNEENV